MIKKLTLLLSTALLVLTSFLININPVLAATYKVKMGTDNGLLQFDPNSITINVGDTVEWVNNKMYPHNVVFSDSDIESHKQMVFSPGNTYETTFTSPGIYPYYCQPHRGAGMLGEVIVE
ncbi:plastocyanin [Xenococcus sp. PCC 7305]|uniref:plastocyanin n=1 Tax=Xenococcus sp. PCC 7305 TaxID=102125 RepID=UPI0002AD0115|nr:plastocyanin [Xenococcus sp. PCC 7305]ELS01387.1 plastocyanin [Xenococcus sp. PCC 7305]